MEHVVFHPGPDGSPAFRRFGSLEDAVRFVEHLRNAEGVSEVSVHALSPVPLAFRAYYKVEMPQEPAAVVDVPAPSEPVYEAVPVPVAEMPVEPLDAAEPVEAVAPVEPAEPVVPEPAFAEAVVAAPAPSNGKKSLGFFAH
jgi:hypothetical protein